jgi:hypothetical protein
MGIKIHLSDSELHVVHSFCSEIVIGVNGCQCLFTKTWQVNLLLLPLLSFEALASSPRHPDWHLCYLPLLINDNKGSHERKMPHNATVTDLFCKLQQEFREVAGEMETQTILSSSLQNFVIICMPLFSH